MVGTMYLLVMQGVKKGEFYSVVGLYESPERLHEGLEKAKASVPKDDLFYETDDEVHEGVEFSVHPIVINKTYPIEPLVIDGYRTDLIVGGVVLND